jgi:hypothetical protein
MADTLMVSEVLRKAAPVAVFQGYDSVTGAGRSTAVQGQTQTVGGPSSVTCQVCEDTSTLATTLNISQSLSVGFGPSFSGDEKMNFLRSLNVTTTSISIVVYARHLKGKEVATNVALESGISSPGHDPGAIRKFFAGYGDSYVSSVTRGGEYYAVYTFYSQTKEEHDSLAMDMKAKGLYSGVSVNAELQTKLDQFTSSTQYRMAFQQNISGIGSPHLPAPGQLVDFAVKFPSLELDVPAVIEFDTEGYERVPAFGSFGTVPASRRYFVGTGVVDGLTTSLMAVQELINQVSWLRQIYNFYQYAGDGRLAEANTLAKKDLDAINRQIVTWTENPTQSFTPPPLPSLALGTPSLNYSVKYTPPYGDNGGSPFDDVNPATCIHKQWRIAKLQMSGNKYVDKLLVEYQSTAGTTKKSHGGGGGVLTKPLTVIPGQFVSQMNARTGKYVDSLQFVLTDGNTLQVGGGGGKPWPWTVPSGSVMLGFAGRSNKYVDQISAAYATFMPAKWQNTR